MSDSGPVPTGGCPQPLIDAINHATLNPDGSLATSHGIRWLLLSTGSSPQWSLATAGDALDGPTKALLSTATALSDGSWQTASGARYWLAHYAGSHPVAKALAWS
jgi:hypothetical protein